MFPDSSIWLVIGIAWVTALLPFFTEKSFVFVPWRQEGESVKTPYWLLVCRALVHWFLIIYAATVLAGPHSQTVKLAAIVASLVLFALPIFVLAKQVRVKSFAVRLFELLGFFFFSGGIGFAIEHFYANSHPQDWQFYAIALCLYIVLAYPGFVIRHLFKNRHNRRLIAQTQIDSD